MRYEQPRHQTRDLVGGEDHGADELLERHRLGPGRVHDHVAAGACLLDADPREVHRVHRLDGIATVAHRSLLAGCASVPQCRRSGMGEPRHDRSRGAAAAGEGSVFSPPGPMNIAAAGLLIWSD
jgi:hypothetical protein